MVGSVSADNSGFRLVVGLGNPGQKYDDTRHNAGFWFVDELARRFSARFSTQAKFQCEVAELSFGGFVVRVQKPLTFMNNSGRAVAGLANYFRIPASQILVAHDDLDLAPGTVRLKLGGGHGGHNGLRDIVSSLGSKEFGRLRIGIGHPGDSRQVISYVLKPPSAEDRKAIEDSIDRALGESERILRGELEAAMNVLHQKSVGASC
jgi:PTH1 family peptidyl-tRNA hydrolase